MSDDHNSCSGVPKVDPIKSRPIENLLKKKSTTVSKGPAAPASPSSFYKYPSLKQITAPKNNNTNQGNVSPSSLLLKKPLTSPVKAKEGSDKKNRPVSN